MMGGVIGIGCDHAGLDLKTKIIWFIENTQNINVTVKDFGCYEPVSVDYPDYGLLVANAVSTGKVSRGILICGTGLGMSIVANKIMGIRATLCNDILTAKMSREHNDSNILVMGSRIIGEDVARMVTWTWLTTLYEGGRHDRRLAKIHEMESVC